MEIEIVPTEGAERRELFALAKRAFGDLAAWDDRVVLDVLARDVVFVAHDDGEPGGYVALCPTRDETITVEQLLVAPGHERRGIGRRLLAHAEGYAIVHGARALRVVVEEDNRAARRFYRRSGFVPFEDEVFELVLPRAT